MLRHTRPLPSAGRDLRVVWTNAAALSGRQAPPTGAPGPQRTSPRLGSRSRAGVLPDGAPPTSQTGCSAPLQPAARLGRQPPASGPKAAFTAAACREARECRAGPSYFVFRMPESGGVVRWAGTSRCRKRACVRLPTLTVPLPVSLDLLGRIFLCGFREGRGPPATRLGQVTDTRLASWAATA